MTDPQTDQKSSAPTGGGSAPAGVGAKWREPSDRLRSNARVFVTSLAAVAVTVVAGLSLTGLGQLDPRSPEFAIALIGALLATLGIVALVAVSVRLAGSSSVSVGELLATETDDETVRRAAVRRARDVVGDPANGLLAGEQTLRDLVDKAEVALTAERDAIQAVAAAPDDRTLIAKQRAASGLAQWYRDRLQIVADAAGYQRLRWHFGAAATWMAVAGSATAIGIVMYAAALQPRDTPAHPIAVAVHDTITIHAPDSASAAALFAATVSCAESSVSAIVLQTTDDGVQAVTVATDGCRSVTLTAKWQHDEWVPVFGALVVPKTAG